MVDLLTCVQAQEFGHALWSLGMRCAGTTHAEIVAAFDAGDLLRTHLLRPTWHLVAAADLGWILAATSDRVHQRTPACTGRRARCRHGGPNDDLLVEMLAGGRSSPGRRSASDWRRRGVEAPVGMRLSYLVMRAELDGLIVSGPLRGKQHTYALAAERLAGRAISTPEDPWPSCGGGSWSVTDRPVCGTSPAGPRSP